MENETEKRLDAIVEDEVHKGYRLKELPAHLQARLQEEGGPALSWVRFTRLNPARRRKIAELVQRQYHKDLRNPDVLSTEQLKKLALERGEWTPEHEAKMATLQASVNKRMGALYFSDGSDEVIMKLLTQTSEFRAQAVELVPPQDQELLFKLFDRWLDYNEDRQAEYDEAFALEQRRPKYSPDLDYQKIQVLSGSAELIAKLDEIEKSRDKINDLVTLKKDRLALFELQSRFARIFADSAEQRREVAEELARVYFTTERTTPDGTPQGPLMEKYEQMENLPDEVAQWFQVENFFFHNNIPDEAREYLSAVGFLPAGQGAKTETSSPTSASEASAESPVPPSSKDDSSVAPATPATSSGSLMVTA
jgi:hypothetical protein